MAIALVADDIAECYFIYRAQYFYYYCRRREYSGTVKIILAFFFLHL
jgi:hypothetical protein